MRAVVRTNSIHRATNRRIRNPITGSDPVSDFKPTIRGKRGGRRYGRDDFQVLIKARSAWERIEKGVRRSIAGDRRNEIGPSATKAGGPLEMIRIGRIGCRPAQLNTGLKVELHLSSTHTRADGKHEGGCGQM